MNESVLLVWDDDLLKYDLGGTHPLHPGRLELTMALADELNVMVRPNLAAWAHRHRPRTPCFPWSMTPTTSRSSGQPR